MKKHFSLSISDKDKGWPITNILDMLDDILRSTKNKGFIKDYTLEPVLDTSHLYNEIVQEFTLQAQNPSNTDAERTIYYLCAEKLHQLNVKILSEQ